MIPIIKNNCIYFTTLLLLIIIACCSWIIYGNSFISIKQLHPFWLNVFFINYTFIGDGFFAVCLVLFIFFYLKNQMQALRVLIAVSISFMFIQLVNNIIAGGTVQLFFEQGQYLFFTDDAGMANYHSFPSGHTANGFAIATILLSNQKSRNTEILVLAMGLLLAFSRVYLAQNTLIEITTGMLAGVSSAMMTYIIINNSTLIKIYFNKWKPNRYKEAIHSGRVRPA